MIPSRLSPLGPDDERPVDQIRKEEPPRSRKEALEMAIHKAYFGETLQMQLDGCEAVLSLGIPIGDREHKQAPIENWESWRDHAIAEKRKVTKSIAVSQTMMHKEGEPGNELRPVGGGTDASTAMSYVRDVHVAEQIARLERTQLRAAVDILKDLVGDLVNVLSERGYFPDSYEDVNIPMDTASSPPTLSRRFEIGGTKIAPQHQEDDGDDDE